MQKAIDAWRRGALKHIEAMSKYTYPADYDGYDPLPPGKCIMATEAQIEQVNTWSRKLDEDWRINGGNIDLDFFRSRILKYSVHENQQSPVLLSIKEKYASALGALSSIKVPQKHLGMDSLLKTSDQKARSLIKPPEVHKEISSESVCNNESKSNTNSSSSSSSSSSATGMFKPVAKVKDNAKLEKIIRGFECPLSMETMVNPYICSLDGQTYDLEGITDWLNKNRTSPHNRKKMEDNQKVEDVLIPNRVLADTIQSFREENPDLFQNGAAKSL